MRYLAKPGISIVILLLMPRVAAPIQYCQEWTQVLLDTTESCVSDPRRPRAFDVETFAWKGHDYMILNVGNELWMYNIDDPDRPVLTAESAFEFGTVGDSDYGLLSFDVCDECRYGILSNQVAGIVLFDLGSGATPQFTAHNSYVDQFFGGIVFNHGLQQYAIAAIPAQCDGDSALFAINSTSSLEFLQCVEADSIGLQIHAGQTLHVGSDTYLYLGELYTGQAHVFEVSGSGVSVQLTYLGAPSGMLASHHSLSVDEDNLLAASANVDAGLVSIWDLTDPTLPTKAWDIAKSRAHYVSLRSPGLGGTPVLSVTASDGINSPSIYLIKSTGPEVMGNAFWSDLSEPHNDFQACVLDQDGALAPDGDAFYWSRYSLHQVFDLSNCFGPTPAIADVTATPSTVFPGQTVTVQDNTVGAYDRWALWVTEQPADMDHGYPIMSPTNPHSFNLTIPQDVVEGSTFTASVSVESDQVVPLQATDSQSIGINRAPTAVFTVSPEAVIVGENVTLTATAQGSPSGYLWEIFAPGSATPQTYAGATVSGLALGTAGEWLVELTVNYLHGSSTSDPDGDGLYEAVAEDTIPVTSVAAVFSITPASPLDTQDITLNGLASKPVGGNLGFFWRVFGPTNRGGEGINPSEYNGCPASHTCVIPSDTLDWGAYTVELTVTNLDDNEDSTATRTMAVGNGAIQPTFSWTPASPEIGEIIIFSINEVPMDIDEATWNMGGTGCDGAPAVQECTPGVFNNCKALAFKYESGGSKVVDLTVEIGGVSFTDTRPAAERTVTVSNDGSCDNDPPPTCTYNLSAASATFEASGGAGSFTVFTTSSCSWTASPSASWIIITAGSSDTGTGTVSFEVAENSGAERTGFIAAGGKIFSVVQAEGVSWDCGNAGYDHGTAEDVDWFGGRNAGNPDYMFGVRFDATDFGYESSPLYLIGFCASNQIDLTDLGGPWPNQVFLYPDDNGLPDDSVVLAQGTIWTGDGNGPSVVSIGFPVLLEGPFWLVNRGDPRWAGEDFNMEYDDDGNSGHSYSSSQGVSGLSLTANGDYMLRATLLPNDLVVHLDDFENGGTWRWSSSVGEDYACGHDLCVAGPVPVPGCHPCVDAVCQADDYCCLIEWDRACVDKVGTVCGITCR